MEVSGKKAHAQRSHSSTPRSVGRQRTGQLTIFVILPSESVCAIRNTPWPVTLDWILCQLELLTGIVTETCTLHYPDGSHLRRDQLLVLKDRSQSAIVLRLHLLEGFHQLWSAVSNDNWKDLKKGILECVLHDATSDQRECETDEVCPDRPFYALFLACSLGRDRLCRKILRNIPDIDRTTRFGHTALHVAACADKVAIADLLLQNEADPTHCNALGQTPLQTAISRSSKECAKKLRFVQFHRRSRGFISYPVQTPEVPKQEDPHTKPIVSRAQRLFSKYGIKETVPKAWVPKNVPGPDTSPRSNPKESCGDMVTDRSKAAKAIKDMRSVSPQCPQWLGDVDTRRAVSAPKNLGKISNATLSQRTSLDMGKKSHWEKIPRARVLLQRSFSDYQPSIEFRTSVGSFSFGNKQKVVDFRLASQKSADGQVPCPSPESRSSPSPIMAEPTKEASEDVGVYRPDSEIGGKIDRQSSCGTQGWDTHGRPEGDRMSPKPPTRAVWVSVKRKLRLAYLKRRAQRTKTGLNERAFKTWMEKKSKEKRGTGSIHVEDSDSESADEYSNDEAFQKWLHDKRNAPQNHRTFRGQYNGVFVIGSTMPGEAKHPNSRLNKDAYKNWRQSRKEPCVNIAPGMTWAQFKQTELYKNMEAHRQQMLTSAVTYEEWMDAKYLRNRFLKEVKEHEAKIKQIASPNVVIGQGC